MADNADLRKHMASPASSSHWSRGSVGDLLVASHMYWLTGYVGDLARKTNSCSVVTASSKARLLAHQHPQ